MSIKLSLNLGRMVKVALYFLENDIKNGVYQKKCIKFKLNVELTFSKHSQFAIFVTIWHRINKSLFKVDQHSVKNGLSYEDSAIK